ncbi:hypothetical protein UlMin_031212 [Ulmus minor]
MLGLWFLQILLLSSITVEAWDASKYSRKDFPPNFVFGSGTSAYQVEGAANEDGRTPSIWDTYAHAGYSKGYTADIGCDHYHKYKEDVQLMADIGLDAYRFSISWSRLIPNGRGPVNPKGLQYYNNLINELLSHGIQPHVSLVNYDHPQALEDEYGGWVSRKIIEDFTRYADVCFREFGDRVRYWTTVNEPNVFSDGGYDSGITPPLRCSPPFGTRSCTKGNSSTEPYIAAHHILLAHASTVRLYRKNYQEKQHGHIGLCIYSLWYAPFADTKDDIIATQRAMDFLIGWVLNPLVFGDYPKVMKENAGSRIPAFTKFESDMVKGSFDFIGIIHYLTVNVADNSVSLMAKQRDYHADQAVTLIADYDFIADFEIPLNPWGLYELLLYLKQVYGNPPVFIYENGQRMQRNSSLEDTSRVKYIDAHIEAMLNAIRNGSDTRGYFVWAFLDVFELFDGYESAYGLYYVDMDDPDLKRYPKLSAHWYSHLLKGKTFGVEEVTAFEDNLSALSS